MFSFLSSARFNFLTSVFLGPGEPTTTLTVEQQTKEKNWLRERMKEEMEGAGVEVHALLDRERLSAWRAFATRFCVEGAERRSGAS